MSTSRSRLTRSIQAIAKQDPDLRRAIEATKPRGDQPSAAGVGTSDAERDRICCDGSTNDSANPGTDTRDTADGGQDASDGLNSDDPADIGDMGPGSLSGLTDCATGEPVCFEGGDWVPPEGWDSPTDGPYYDSYVEGFYYSSSKGEAPVVEALVGLYQGGRNLQPSPSSGENCWRWDHNELPYYRTISCAQSCANETHEGEPYCNPSDDEIRQDSWPSDSCVNLAIRGGSIVGSKYDPENDGSYSKPMSEIQLCDDFGNSFYLRPSAGGGWKSISDLTTGPDGYLYDSTGMQIRRISHGEFTDSTV